MSILKIARMGHPVLRAIAQPVDDPTAPETRQLVADMIDTLADIGGIGLAAPQVHVSLRVVIFRVPEERVSGVDGDEAIGLGAIINPVLEPVGDDMNLGWEGCLSVPGMRGAVPRFTRLHYTGYDLDGGRIDRLVSGYHARVLQHECDHLDGVLYPQRMTDHRLLGFVEESGRFPIDLAAYAEDGRL